MDLLAFFVVTVVVGTWLGIRFSDANRRVDDLIATVLSTPVQRPSACAACDPGAADTGARVGESPRPGAGSPLIPAPVASTTGQSARPASGRTT